MARGAAALAAALLLGGLGGRATAPSPSGRGPVVAAAQASPGSQVVAGVPVSFAETRAGAAAAIAAYQQSFASPAILRPAVMRARVRAVATADYAAKLLEVNRPGVERIAAGPIGLGISHNLRTVYTAVPIGYRVQSFSPSRARLLTWGFTLLGNASAVEPAAYFGLTHTELVRQEGTWKIAETRAGFGPTPKLATKPGPLGAYDVIDLAQELRSYALAP